MLLLVSLLSALAGEPPPTAPPGPQIPFERYELPNGLDVILSEDHSVPFVWVNVYYAVGSKDEVAGRSGFAHLFEHMLFQGSEHADSDYFKPLQAVGASINGNTTLDRTDYFEGVPSEHLGLALFMESDRMGWLLPAMTEEKLANQKEVVRNERRQNYEVRPYGDLWPLYLENLYPEGHPYHIATIGKHEDLKAATLADVSTFFKQWYLPNNASLSIVGDFDPAEAKALVEKYFGEVPRGPDVTRAPLTPAALTAPKRVAVERDVPFPVAWLGWHTPAIFAPDDAELDFIAHILTDGKDSRLYKALVRDQKIAQEVDAGQGSQALQSQFMITAKAAGGHSSDELVKALEKVLADVQKKPFTADEVELARTTLELSFYDQLATIQGRSYLLNNYNMLAGSPGYLTQDLARYRSATVASVNAAFQKWLATPNHLTLQVNPAPKKPVDSHNAAPPVKP